VHSRRGRALRVLKNPAPEGAIPDAPETDSHAREGTGLTTNHEIAKDRLRGARTTPHGERPERSHAFSIFVGAEGQAVFTSVASRQRPR